MWRYRAPGKIASRTRLVACSGELCSRDLHGDLSAEPGSCGQAEVIAAPEPAGVIPPWPRRIMEALLAEGFSQADLARELGVTRQVIQKIIAVGAERRGK